ncbi:hypothetical protein SCHPADRAFT_490861 [Schizopora paradoxa]|uniref:Uncharacterized protein n=1 Tax=Schizopora paradoxa TaxID=27342 RepID=A0A0H2RHL3_9AGAM|nr:hypothetical protein SCHPADRAFT_490861 [Schizopora paradoxa]
MKLIRANSPLSRRNYSLRLFASRPFPSLSVTTDFQTPSSSSSCNKRVRTEWKNLNATKLSVTHNPTSNSNAQQLPSSPTLLSPGVCLLCPITTRLTSYVQLSVTSLIAFPFSFFPSQLELERKLARAPPTGRWQFEFGNPISN